MFKCYLKRPDLDAKSLSVHPKYGRLYKTGDLVRLRSDGNLVFLGRADFQVKINGQRLELGEIEATIMNHPRSVAVVDAKHEEKGRAFLVAYVAIREFKDSSEWQQNELKGELTGLCKKSLPPFMVPSAWVLLNRMPLNSNGKVDRKQLPAPQLARAYRVAVAPRTELEKQIHAVFAAAMQRPDLSVDDDFFAVGGSSLLAMTMLGRLRLASPALAGLTMSSIFDHSSVDELAAFVSRNGHLALTHWPRLGLSAGVASAAQQRIYLDTHVRLQQQMGSRSLSMYNVPIGFRIRGNIDSARLDKCLTAIASRHEALRTALQMDGGSDSLKQVVLPTTSRFAIQQRVAKSEQELQRTFDDLANEPFDLAAGLNLRCWRVAAVETRCDSVESQGKAVKTCHRRIHSNEAFYCRQKLKNCCTTQMSTRATHRRSVIR